MKPNRLAILMSIGAVALSSCGGVTPDLHSEDADARYAAVQQLGKHGGDEAIETLVQLLRQDPDALVRAKCAQALAHLQAQQTAPALVQALEDESALVRRDACRALGLIGGCEAAPLLRVLGGDEAQEVRAEAARALARFPGKATIEALILALSPEAPYQVRTIAHRSLMALTGIDLELDSEAWMNWFSEQ